ncbi:MAG TPA: hypothetical protein VJV96_19780 [Candidatus Angelobacter sp.]|jgi:hypothetical protein|nr:hypothetical protein [Candidatus Angelobacter sp.]
MISTVVDAPPSVIGIPAQGAIYGLFTNSRFIKTDRELAVTRDASAGTK